ncbi:glycosyltransferase [Mycobacterium branderi]|uniref:Glycosyl transferase family 1 n=1 Tax=Mycobacterium branderi TaxID=43348 RepID=A0A7I7WB15_9MYCO|nr:glycosyltransferase [Mycobacterium branderi]MCV7235098.1 glycosyltransferase [Mycobacterium branderi]ORA33413.1 glycosyl transferase family 1 [Mycobacterium branderi]BBZ13028.1 glycosyltransferase [Mycobacterium branderi]
MKFVLASWGSRGDVEPFGAVGRELQRRGHEVCIAVPPDLVGFIEAAGVTAVGYGPDLRGIADAHRDYWTCFFRHFWKLGDLNKLRSAVWEPVAERWEEMSSTLTSLADGADLLFTGLNFENAAANVAEYHDIPLATLHFFPLRANGQLLPFLPAPLGRGAISVFWWMSWLGSKKLEDTQRSNLGLPKTKGSAPRRITERGSLEIQAYDEVCFPGLAAEWAKWNGQRPFVGSLTIELPTDVDDEVVSWIEAGTPPIFFGFGSIPVVSPAEKVAMISAACAQLGERALVCAGSSDFSNVPHFEHVKVVDTLNYAAVFPACRAVVHHGAPGTTAAGLRAGIPTLSLPTDLDQTLWGAAIKRLKVGTARHFSTATQETLVDDLRTILAPQYAARARDIASRMTKPAESVLTAADLVEKFARVGRVG